FNRLISNLKWHGQIAVRIYAEPDLVFLRVKQPSEPEVGFVADSKRRRRDLLVPDRFWPSHFSLVVQRFHETMDELSPQMQFHFHLLRQGPRTRHGIGRWL